MYMFSMSHIVWHSEKIKQKLRKSTSVSFRGTNWENIQFYADADIYKARKSDKILTACNVNKCDLYNSIADCLHKII